jgi:hypothetical protein
VILASFKSPEGFDCYLHALRFYTTYEKADYYDAQDCAEKASKALPADANVLALVALLELAGASSGYDGPPSPERRIRAAKIADQAYRINDLAPFRALQVVRRQNRGQVLLGTL